MEGFQSSIHILDFRDQVLHSNSSALTIYLGRMSTTTTIIDGKNGSVPSSSMKVGKKSVTEDLVTTFSSPAAWILVVALIVTWSAVAIVMFDLVDYKAFAGKIQYILFDVLYIKIQTFIKDCVLSKFACLSPSWSQHSVSAEFNERGDIVRKVRRY